MLVQDLDIHLRALCSSELQGFETRASEKPSFCEACRYISTWAMCARKDFTCSSEVSKRPAQLGMSSSSVGIGKREHSGNEGTRM